MGVLIHDFGNSIIKTKTTNKEVVFALVIQPLTECKYQKFISCASVYGNSADYSQVNGKSNIVGKRAERHGVLVQCSGSARYTCDYYGILAVAALSRLYERGREMAIFGSYL